MSLSRVRLLETPWTAAHQAPPSMGFSRQEYWSGVPLPSPKKYQKRKINVIKEDKFYFVEIIIEMLLLGSVYVLITSLVDST